MSVAILVMGVENWVYPKDEQIKWTNFLYGGANWGKVKIILMIFGLVGSKIKNGRGHLVHETL